MLHRLGLGSVATKNCGKVATYVDTSFVSRRPCLGLVATKGISEVPRCIVRSFHIHRPHHSDCDCTLCRIARHPMCDICRAIPAKHQYRQRPSFTDKVILSVTFSSFCDRCWIMHLKRAKTRAYEEKQTRILRNDKAVNMLESGRGLPSSRRVPIAYAVDKFKYDIKHGTVHAVEGWAEQHIITNLSQELEVVEKGDKYMCDEGKVNAMDFRLWYFRNDLDVDIQQVQSTSDAQQPGRSPTE